MCYSIISNLKDVHELISTYGLDSHGEDPLDLLSVAYLISPFLRLQRLLFSWASVKVDSPVFPSTLDAG
jgi:hypothetical protein